MGSPTTTTRYYYDDQRIVLQTESDGQTQTDRTFIFGNYIDEVLVMSVIPAQGAIQDYYYGHDHLYSPTVLFSNSGAVVERYEYDVYGACRVLTSNFSLLPSGSAYGNPYTFTGRELDSVDNNSFKLMYYRARSYNPQTGRFLQRDPAQYFDSTNMYEYVKSSPMNNTDAYGRWGRTVHYDSTRIWARKVGYSGEAASAIAEADNVVDSISGGISPAPGVGDQSYHFNRNFSGEDSRFVHFKEHCSSAKKLCMENDNPEAAAEQLGTALHPLQDYVAHGDYFIFCHEPILRIHNSHSPQRDFGEPENYPDDTRLDVQGSPDGRATIRFMKRRNNNATDQDYAIYEWGHKRIQMTKSATEVVLEEYLEHIKSHGKCRCKQYFGVK